MAWRAQDWQKIRANSGLPPLEFAAAVYSHRNLSDEQRKQDGWPAIYPYQPFGFKVGGFKMWYPHPLEVRPCCQAIEVPHPAYPWTYQRHCRTARHVAALVDVTEQALLAHLGIRVGQARCAQCSRFRPADDYLCGVCRKNIDLD
jgi:hypothetical protein